MDFRRGVNTSACRAIFFGQLELWNYFNKKNLDYKKLNMPRFGNQNGAYIEGNFVVIGSFAS